MTKQNRNLFGNRTPLDLDKCHADWRVVYEAYRRSFPTPKSSQLARITAARRLLHHAGLAWPTVSPRELGQAEGDAHRAWVHANYRAGMCFFHGARELVDLAVTMGLRGSSSPNPFDTLVSTVTLPPNVPQAVLDGRADLVAWTQRKATARITSNGKEGFSEDYGRATVRAFDSCVAFLLRGYKPEDVTLDALFSDPTLIAEFLTEAPSWGWTRETTPNEKTRQMRLNSLLVAYRFFRWKSKGTIGAPDFPQRLKEHIREDRRSLYLGGGDALVIDALTLKEVHAVDAHHARRVERARRDWTVASPEAMPVLRREVLHALRARALSEVGLWCGLRVEGIASMCLSGLQQLATGTWVCDLVRVKANGKAMWQRIYVAPRAARAILEYLAFDGRGLQQARWGRAIHVPAFGRIANTQIAAARDFYPIFRTESGDPLSTKLVSKIISRVLSASGCSCSRAHVLRHTAASIALNEWLLSIKEVCEIFKWETESMVWKRYAKSQLDAIYAKFDALSEQEFGLLGNASALVHQAVLALAQLMQELAAKGPSEQSLPAAWNGIVGALDTLAAVGHDPRPISSLFTFTPEEVERIAGYISEKSDRHLTLDKFLGRRVAPGLPMPTPRTTDDGDAVAAA